MLTPKELDLKTFEICTMEDTPRLIWCVSAKSPDQAWAKFCALRCLGPLKPDRSDYTIKEIVNHP